MSDPTPVLPADAPAQTGLVCPNCSIALVSRKMSRGMMYTCPRCRGRSVGLAVLRRALGGPLVFNLWSHARVAARGGGKTCPDCRRPMTDVVTAAKHASVHLDVCPRCQLTWFDAGEFEAFPRTSGAQPHPLEASLEAREAAAMAELKRDAMRRHGPEFGGGQEPDESWKWLPAMFGLPVEEDSSVARWPWLTWGLSAVLVVTFLLTWPNLAWAVQQFALIPAHAWRHGGTTLLTSFFIHGSLLHLFGNLYFLWVFGDNVENDLGRWRYAALLLASTLAGDFAHMALDVRPAYAAFFLWIGWQLVIAFLQTHAAGDVSGLAHVGGAIAGCIAWVLHRAARGWSADE